MESSFENIKTNDLEAGVELYKALKLSPLDMRDPSKFNAMQEISEYLNGHPDPAWLVRTLAAKNKNPNRSQLEHILSYVRLDKERMAAKAKLDSLEKETKYYL